MSRDFARLTDSTGYVCLSAAGGGSASPGGFRMWVGRAAGALVRAAAESVGMPPESAEMPMGRTAV
ncbi:hypothetical protein SPAR_04750 [Streptomyces sparsogenes DSM 40356]|uniref:Uncharacterized protein n=1 Tax=Streptomyces sparsogenes DSM 40356 TaxID=1331668 RepID=A0A1R1SQS9_9ACTN|nr:hypothetical protein SPAR_04750 [Streptomyces sparsogenes DSM 40356]